MIRSGLAMRVGFFYLLLAIIPVQNIQASENLPPYELTKKSSLQDHLLHSFQRTYRRMGVSASALSAFAKSIQLGPRGLRSIRIYKVNESRDCVEELSDSDHGRSQLVECLANFGRSGLDTRLFHRIFSARSQRIKQVPTTPEIQQTVALLYWIQDLIRAKLLSEGERAVWYVPSEGFLSIDKKGDFDYEDGDVALVTGKSSISSLISQVTYPQRKFSHAFVVRIRDGVLATAEALIESGMITNDVDQYNKDNLQVVEVHRWADKTQRLAFSQRASDITWKWVEEERPYDIKMDMKDDSELFCSEVVAAAYAKSSGLPIDGFVPELSRIRSKPVFDYIRKIGVANEIMPSPGDLAPSRYLEQVAEYRNPDDLSKLWWLMVMGDVVVERLEAGFKLRPRHWVSLATFLGFTLDGAIDVIRELFGPDLNLVPQGLNREAIATMATQQKFLYDRAFLHAEDTLREAGYLNPHDLLSVEPWVLRGHFSYAIQESYWPRRVFKQR